MKDVLIVKADKRAVNGVLILDKVVGISSNKALQNVKHLYQAKKAGHTGSLDPLASGMLPICFGEATKFSQYLLDADKEYYTVGRLGIRTASGDAEGEIVETRPIPEISTAHLQQILAEFIGAIAQCPPMYSALKHQGQPLYKLARQGIEVERKLRHVQIHQLDLKEHTPEIISVNVRCSKGTYIRTLIEDIGEKLGCGAHVTVLRRLSAGIFIEPQMITATALEKLFTQGGLAALDEQLLAIDSLLTAFPAVHLSSAEASAIQMGQAIDKDCTETGLIKMYAQGMFIGMGKINASKLMPERLLSSVN